jgi:hypothetical protein
MDGTIKHYSEDTFESIKHINEFGQEYWLARELQRVLEYSDYRNFELTIFKAMEACKTAGGQIEDHFGEVTEMVEIGSGAHRELKSYELSRYACYLIVMNGDPRKEVIAVGQTYFAVKTRQQELIDQYIGEYEFRGEVNMNVIPPIMSRELFDRVQKRIEESAKAPARHKAKEEVYLLTTKLFCGYSVSSRIIPSPRPANNQ